MDPIRYITEPKENNIQLENPELTKFPEFSKFISTSRNLSKAGIKNEGICDKKEVQGILREAQQDKNAKVNVNGHCFSSNKFCIDQAIIQNAPHKIKKEENLLFEDIF